MVGNNNGSVTVCFGFRVLSLFSHYLLFSLLRERAKKLPVMCFIAQNKKHRQMPKKGFPTRQKKANKKKYKISKLSKLSYHQTMTEFLLG